MKNIIEINWINTECIPFEILEKMTEDDTILVKHKNGAIEVCHIAYNDVFRVKYSDKFGDDDYSFMIKDEESEKYVDVDVETVLKNNEILFYMHEYYSEYGDYAGEGFIFYDDIQEVAMIPNNPVVCALLNFE